MAWTNYGLLKFTHSNTDNFTSDIGIKIRRVVHPVVRFALKKSLGGKITVKNYPKLQKDTSYIFICTHSFVDEVQLILGTLDRSTYALTGTTHQLEHNPMFYMQWISGMIYVNRFSKESRSSAISKMKRILDSGSSMLIFPEGGWNNTENLPVMQLFASPWILAKETGCEVVPLSCFYEYGTKDYYISFGKPVDISKMEKDEALTVLRNTLAALWWDLIEKHAASIKRSELGRNCRNDYMRQRCCEYRKAKWSRDVFNEELTQYFDKEYPTPQMVRASFDKVHITPFNANTMAEIMVRREEDKRYDFTQYMHDNWNKPF